MRKLLNLLFLTTVLLSILVVRCSTQNEQNLSQRKVISVSGSVAGAPYSSGILIGNTLYCSGSIGVNTETNELGADIREQTRLAPDIIKSIVVE